MVGRHREGAWLSGHGPRTSVENRALFPRWTNHAVALALLTAAAAIAFSRSRQGYEPEQPLPFDHRKHSARQGIECLYCHRGAERSPMAGIPASMLCTGCHGQSLEQVRRANDQPIAWVKVHDLPDTVYFDHSAHLGKKISCETCHGRVDQMEKVRQEAPLTEAWCRSCHQQMQARESCDACHR